MPSIVFDEKLTSDDLRSLKKKTKVESPSGEVLGYFTPLGDDKAFLASVRAWEHTLHAKDVKAAQSGTEEILAADVPRKLRKPVRKFFEVELDPAELAWAASVVDLKELEEARKETECVSTAELVRKLREAVAKSQT